MKVFNEEQNGGRQGPNYLLLLESKAEGQTLLEMLQFAAEQNKRRATWKRLAKQAEELLSVY